MTLLGSIFLFCSIYIYTRIYCSKLHGIPCLVLRAKLRHKRSKKTHPESPSKILPVHPVTQTRERSVAQTKKASSSSSPSHLVSVDNKTVARIEGNKKTKRKKTNHPGQVTTSSLYLNPTSSSSFNLLRNTSISSSTSFLLVVYLFIHLAVVSQMCPARQFLLPLRIVT